MGEMDREGKEDTILAHHSVSPVLAFNAHLLLCAGS